MTWGVKRQAVKILKKPRIRITGIDHKKNLLEQAEHLGFYENLVHRDLNKRLPLGDWSFSSVFSNTLYWISNVRGLVRECHRVLRSGGKMVAFVPDSGFVRNMILRKANPARVGQKIDFE